MKKFTKVCLTAAAVLAVLGLVLCGVFGALGGFRQLRQINDGTIYSLVPIAYSGTDEDWSEWDEDFEDMEEDWDDLEDTEDMDEDWDEMNLADMEEAAGWNADQITKLNLSLKACYLSIQPSKDDNIWLSVSGNKDEVKYRIDGETLVIKTRKKDNWLQYVNMRQNNARVVLQIPEDKYFEQLDMEFGAGKIKSMVLQADDMEIELGAGKCDIEGLSAEKMDLSIGAGKMTIGSLKAHKAAIELGAGEMSVKEVVIPEKLDVEIGMGNAVIEGSVTGKMTAECGMGSLQLQLDDSEKAHNYSIDCAMGNVTIGNMNYSGMAASKEINNDADSKFDISCAMGNVSLRFAE